MINLADPVTRHILGWFDAVRADGILYDTDGTWIGPWWVDRSRRVCHNRIIWG